LTNYGHSWIGLDISRAMIDVARERSSEGDMLLADAGQPLRVRPGMFDGAVSISAIQWLCVADRKSHEPFYRLSTFFKWLFNALARGARAVLQFYPDSPQQAEIITAAAIRSGFGGGLVVDYPNSTRAKKYFLCLWAGHSGTHATLPQAITDTCMESTKVTNAARERRSGKLNGKRKAVKNRDWILNKKDHQRVQGKDVRPDTKYTGRKRQDKF